MFATNLKHVRGAISKRNDHPMIMKNVHDIMQPSETYSPVSIEIHVSIIWKLVNIAHS